MIRMCVLTLIAATAPAQEIYDLLLKNGNVIDVANGRTGKFDIGVIGTKIATVAKDIPAVQGRVVVEAGAYYVTPGLIDISANLGPLTGERTVQPDHNTLRYGVTTVVDAGSSPDFETFRKGVMDHARVRVLAFVPAAGDPVRAIRQYPKQIVGIRVASSADVDTALKAAGQTGTVLLADTPLASGDLKRMRSGDIQTQLFAQQLSEPVIREAQKRGIVFDVGHGSTFRIAAPAIQRGLLPDTISTGLDRGSVLLARANMATTMSKFLNLGLTIEQIVERTTVRPARAIGHPELGTLTEGAAADIALFAVEKGSFGFLDAANTRLTGDRQVRCVLTIRNGVVVWDSDGLFAPDSQRIGPYSNFK